MIAWAITGVAVVLIYGMLSTRDWDALLLQMPAVIILGLLLGANLNIIASILEWVLYASADL